MNVFKQFVLSLYSPKHIASFRNQGIGKTILYVFLLTLLFIIPSSYNMVVSIKDGISILKDGLEDGLPAFTIHNGKLDSKADTPVSITKGGFEFIVDDTGSMDAEDLTSVNGLALLRDQFVIIINGQEQATDYSMMDGIELTSDDIKGLLDSSTSILTIVLPFIIGFYFIFTAALNFVKISFLAFFGRVFAVTAGLGYRHIWRMTAYSITLPTVFFMIMDMFHTPVPFGSPLGWAVTLIILFLAVKEVKKTFNI
ncbi:DUF1189 domain-containing protein [Peribacillus sp. SCS-155]|uniref:DUF1189 domain-containing protein n=1 Tax=Peribacillus sedimenti TaxID=3115297 RepID=UPI003905C781